MGTFIVPIRVSDPAGKRSKWFDALVNTGAFNTILPASVLHTLGIEPKTNRSFKLPDGSIRDFNMGEACIELEGKTTRTLVIFGEEEVLPALGKLTLAGLLLEVDAERECLIPVTPRLCNHPYPVHPVHRC